MTRRRYVGVDIHDDEIRIAGLRRGLRRDGQALVSRIESVPGLLGAKDLKGMDPSAEQSLVASLREVLQAVALKERRVAVSLPDRYGYVMNLQLDSFSRSRKEGMEIVMWQMHKLLPGLAELQVDYQVLQRSSGGPVHVLVVAMEKQTLGLYENLFHKAGFIPEMIGFHGLHIYRHWRYRLDTEEDAILVITNEDGIIVQTYRKGVLEYYRARAVGAQVAHQVQELHRIVAGGRAHEFSGLGRCRVFLHADDTVAPATIEALSECFGRKVQVLEGHAHISPALAAALGAAECLMMGG
jgi:Tfp pilus assembly PilM family ATPase